MNAPADPTNLPGPDATPQSTRDLRRSRGAMSAGPAQADALESELFAPIPAPLADGPTGPAGVLPGAADVRGHLPVLDPEPELVARNGSVGSWSRQAARRPLVAGMAAAAGLILAVGGAFGVGHVVERSGSDGIEISDAGGGAQADGVQVPVAPASTGGQASTSPALPSGSAAAGQVAPLPMSDDESS